MAKYEFLLQTVSSRAETSYLVGHLGRQEDWGVEGEAVKVEEIDRLRGEWRDSHQVLASGNWKTKVHPSHSAWVEEILRKAVCFTQGNTKELFPPSNVDCNITSHLHVSAVLIPFICANLEVDY